MMAAVSHPKMTTTRNFALVAVMRMRIMIQVLLVVICCLSIRTTSAFTPSSSRSSINGILARPGGYCFSPSLHQQHHRHAYSSSISSSRLGNSAASSLSLSSSTTNTKNDSAAADDEESALSFLSPLNEYVSAGVLILLDVAFRKAFVQAQITFPSSLAACCVVFTTLLLYPQRSLANAAVRVVLQPGAALLAKWLPVFFVPSLVVLPLVNVNDALGGRGEVTKVILVLVGGFFWTLLTTALSVVSVRQCFASSSPPDNDNNNNNNSNNKVEQSNEKNVPNEKKDLQEVALQAVRYAESRRGSSGNTRGPFSNQLYEGLLTATAASGFGAVVFSLLRFKLLSIPLTSLYLLSATLSGFVFGTRLPQQFCKVVHPLITCGCLTWMASAVLAKLTPAASFQAMLKSYMKGKLTWTGGAGDLLLFMLGPAVVSLSISMYEKRRLMRQNLKEVATAVGVSTVGGIFGTALLVRLLQIINPSLRLALLSRNITSPLAMAIAAILGADVSLAVAAVVLTGIFGANFGASILTAFGVHDPVARGLGIGAAAHGLGTASFVNEKDAFPFAAIAMALTATAATVTVSIPLFRRIILQLALG